MRLCKFRCGAVGNAWPASKRTPIGHLLPIAALRATGNDAQGTLDSVLAKTRFWQRWATTPFNEWQVELLNRLLDGLEGKLTSSKWAPIAKCSPDTAPRDINELVARGVPRKSGAGGRSTAYELTE